DRVQTSIDPLATVTKKARSPGRARNKPLKPLRAGMPGVPVDLGGLHSCAPYTLHTRLRVRRAPGIPHALCFPGRRIHARLGRIAPRDRGLACCCHCEERSDEAIQSLVAALDCFAEPLRNYLNCGIVGALMRGGAIGPPLEAFPIPLGSTNISSAPIVAAFGRPPPKCPIAAEPPPRPPPP